MEKKSASVFGKYEFNKNKTKQKPGKLFSMGKPKILPWKILLEPGVWSQSHLRITWENEQKTFSP